MKSNLVYIVNVEEYKYQMFAVKFYIKSNRLSSNRYRLLSNTFEPRRIINTCVNIMLSIYQQNKNASFGFVGACGMDEDSSFETKRYRVYSRLVATYFSSVHFFHKENKDKSAYILVNNKMLNSNPNLIEEIESFFDALYEFE